MAEHVLGYAKTVTISASAMSNVARPASKVATPLRQLTILSTSPETVGNESAVFCLCEAKEILKGKDETNDGSWTKMRAMKKRRGAFDARRAFISGVPTGMEWKTSTDVLQGPNLL